MRISILPRDGSRRLRIGVRQTGEAQARLCIIPTIFPSSIAPFALVFLSAGPRRGVAALRRMGAGAIPSVSFEGHRVTAIELSPSRTTGSMIDGVAGPRDWSLREWLLGIAGTVIVGLIVFALTHSSPTPNTINNAGDTGGSSTPIPSTPAVAVKLPAYLDTLSQIGGDQIQPGNCTIDGVQYPHGLLFTIGVGSDPQSADYRIPSNAKTFTAVIGNDDTQKNIDGAYESLTYELFVNGRRLQDWSVQGTSHPQGLQVVSLPAGATKLTLKITASAGTEEGLTTADWAGAAFN